MTQSLVNHLIVWLQLLSRSLHAMGIPERVHHVRQLFGAQAKYPVAMDVRETQILACHIGVLHVVFTSECARFLHAALLASKFKG